jgi:hypothetical protein
MIWTVYLLLDSKNGLSIGVKLGQTDSAEKWRSSGS